jgi:hypothetical protein
MPTRVYFARDHSVEVEQDLDTLLGRARSTPTAVEASTGRGEQYVINWANVWYCSPVQTKTGS